MAEGYRCVHAILSILTTAGRGCLGLAQDANNSNIPNNLLVPRQALWNDNTRKWTKLTENGFEVGEGEDDVPSSEPGSRFSEISRSDAAKAARYVRGLLALSDLSGKRTIPIDSFRDLVDFNSPDFQILHNWIMGIWSKTDTRRTRNNREFPADSFCVRDLIVNIIDKSGSGAGDDKFATCPLSFIACLNEIAQEFLGDDAFVQQNVVDPILIPSFKFLHGMVWRGADMQKSKAHRDETLQRGRGRGRGSRGRVGTRGNRPHTSTQAAPLIKRRGRPPKMRQDGHNLRPAPRVSSRYMDATPGWSNGQPIINLVDDEEDVKMENVDQNEPQLAYPDASQLPGPSDSQMNVKQSQGNVAGEQNPTSAGTAERSDSSSRSQRAHYVLPAVSASSNDVLAQLLYNVKDLNETEKWEILGEAVQVQQQWQALQNKLREKRLAQEDREDN